MKTATHEFTHHVSVPSDEGIRVDKAITINRPVPDVYSFWRQLDNLPKFMGHVESVTVQDELHSHWVVKTIAGKRLEWDAEIIEQRDNEMISWRSAPGADIDNAGSVWFTPVPGGNGTLVRVEMKYVPPAGEAGALVAKALGRDAAAEIQEDLNRLKTLLETGELPEKRNPSPLRRAGQTVGQKVSQAAHATNECVHNHTWTAIASISLCALALGFLIGWRWSEARD
ncbi:MAG TPA: SRPBCC family protein [Candidatus Eisenbacteria bacterium]|nr:SRPBCC family protein [Candidatus Eisenbacteria bacterium]